MNDIANNVQTNPHKKLQDIEELESKYDKINKEVKQLKGNNIALDIDIKQIHVEFKQVNKNIEDILQNLNKLSNKCIDIGNKTNEGDDKIHSMKIFFTSFLKKIAIGTLCVVYSVADKTIDKTSKFKQSFESISAEAQYVNKKKRCPSIENS